MEATARRGGVFRKCRVHHRRPVACGFEVEYTRGALGRDITLSYALTVHKAQGSEYPVVVLPLKAPGVRGMR